MMLAQADCRELPLAENSVDLIFTDPPYLREFLPTYGWLSREAMRVLKPGGFVLAMCGGSYLNQIFRMMDEAGLSFYWQIVIEKASFNPGVVWKDGKPVCNFYKAVLAYSKGGPNMEQVTGNFYDLFSSRTTPDKSWHHWGQNVNNARYYVESFSLPGSLVADPFIGGGTTAIACELVGRRCVGFDVDPGALRTSASRLMSADILHSLPLFADAQVQS